MFNKTDYYVQINIFDIKLKVFLIQNNHIIHEDTFDLLDSDFKESSLFNVLMNHYKDYKVLISWQDLRFLRKIGIRI